MTAAVAFPSALPVLVDGGEIEKGRRAGGKKLSSIFSNRNVFVLRKKLRSSSLSATLTSDSSAVHSKTASNRSSSTTLSDYDHCSTSNSRLSTSPLSPHSAWSDDSDDYIDEDDIHHMQHMQGASTMSDEDEQRDVVSPPSSSCSFSSSTSSSSSGSSASSSASLSPLPTLISPSSSRTRRRLHVKEAQSEQKEAHASLLPPPSPIVALPPLHPHALTHSHAALPLAHLHALAASSPSVVGPAPSSSRQQQQQHSRHSVAATTILTQPPPSSAAASPVKTGKHHRSHSASNQFILLQGGNNGQSPSARSPTTHHSVYGTPVLTSPFPSPLPSTNIQLSPYSHQHQQLQQQQHQHHNHFRHAPPSPLVFSPQSNRSQPQYMSSAIFPSSPYLFMPHQPLSTPSSPTMHHGQIPASPPTNTAAQYVDNNGAATYGTSNAAAHPATAFTASSPPPPLSAVHAAIVARPSLTRAASVLLDNGSILHPHPRRSSMLDLAALESSHNHATKPRSVSSAATFSSLESNGAHTSQQIAVSHPSPTELQRLLATPLAALLGLTESDASRSHVPKALARCAQARCSPQLGYGLAQAPTTQSATPLAQTSAFIIAPSPLSLHRELAPVVPSSPASYANIASSLPRRLSITSTTSSVSPTLGSASPIDKDSRLPSCSSVPPSPIVKSLPASPIVAPRDGASPLHPPPSPSISGTAQTSPSTPALVLAPSSRQTLQSTAGASSQLQADNRWQKPKQSNKQRQREAKPASSAPHSLDATGPAILQQDATLCDKTPAMNASASAADVAQPSSQQADVLQMEFSEADKPVKAASSAAMEAGTAPPSSTGANTTAVSDTASSKAPAGKRLRPSRAARQRAPIPATLLPTVSDSVNRVTPDAATSSHIHRSLSMRFSLVALHTSLLSAMSSFYIALSTAAIQRWGALCAFYHSLFPTSSTRRRFVSRLRSLTNQQQQKQPEPQPASVRHSHSLRYRHHPLLERQRLTKESQQAVSAGEEVVEVPFPRGLMVCMVLCCMFLGTVVFTCLMYNRGQ